MADADPDTTRTSVKTYVPAYQKAEWQRHAEDLDMSHSEFVRTMVQAGRRGFGSHRQGATAASSDSREADATPQATDDDLRSRVVEILAEGDHPDWDELLDRVTERVEERMADVLQELQAENRVQHSGRHGGYALLDDE